ncbi:hypothetical protein EB118_01740 [bacterium]|nr:hypothetical protein [bacterium]NBX97946.1 hypothetical protein [bacterium]NDC94626.1 hypothetical protein [bacterium]NDD83783.1 hypothetical protein [bacterium]NDG28810.1 hypothetical protein [bacterium]
MKSALERFPTPEDWVALQGGKPTILGNAAGDGLFLVVHDYGDKTLAQFGMIVPTPHDQMMNSILNPVELTYTLQNQQHDVRVPAVLLAAHHGLACNQKSYDARGSSYEVLNKNTSRELAIQKGLVPFRLGVLATGQQLLSRIK